MELVRKYVERRCAQQRLRCVIAIPVKDEVARLPACLTALQTQQDALRRPFGVVLLVNNCSDESAKVARALSEGLAFPLRVVEATFPPNAAHAGSARRAAMDIAAEWLSNSGRRGVILTTDADSQVPPRWIAENLTAIEAGADAVLGRIALDEEGDLLPAELHRRGRLEGAYEALLTELSALLDPLDHNPWPHHATISGASIAVTREIYLRIGGLPPVPLGEDKALVRELSRHDAKIRFCPNIQVVTSGRVHGRAPGGVADTLRLRSLATNACCDEALEPFRASIRRAKWRRRLRRLHSAGALIDDNSWVRDLRVPASLFPLSASSFGTLWSTVETASPRLGRIRLTPAELPAQIAGARLALTKLRTNPLARLSFSDRRAREPSEAASAKETAAFASVLRSGALAQSIL
jgi:GT2 family glycosyltransferase